MKKTLKLTVMAAALTCMILTGSLLTGCGSRNAASGTGEAEASGQEAEKAGQTEVSAGKTVEAGGTEGSAADTGQSKEAPEELSEIPAVLEDGTYTAVFTTDSSMFHVNEACENKGVLTVSDGQMAIHVTLASKNIVNLFPGTAEEAQAEGAVLLEPTTDQVDYKDGTSEEAYGFDIPVPAIGEEFDCALVGKKGKWYDHKVMVSDPVKSE